MNSGIIHENDGSYRPEMEGMDESNSGKFQKRKKILKAFQYCPNVRSFTELLTLKVHDQPPPALASITA